MRIFSSSDHCVLRLNWLSLLVLLTTIHECLFCLTSLLEVNQASFKQCFNMCVYFTIHIYTLSIAHIFPFLNPFPFYR